MTISEGIIEVLENIYFFPSQNISYRSLQNRVLQYATLGILTEKNYTRNVWKRQRHTFGDKFIELFRIFPFLHYDL